jgi:two-component system, NtrC family, response regulator AtoC
MDPDPQKTALEPERKAGITGDLLLVTGLGQFQSHRIETDEIKIGRATDCDVVIDHRALSRYHVLVRVKPALSIQDLGSTNGTRIGTSLLKGGEPMALVVGEAFHIGPFSFLVVASAKQKHPGAASADPLVVDDPTRDGVSPLVREIAASPVNVLVLGETGVGKEVLAHTLHELSGRSGPLMRINCAALSESLLESELFGHEKGAFTGAVAARKGLLEAAAGGTVFLDEIGEMPLGIQAKLLRAVEAREVLRLGSTKALPIDVRFVAATNRDLAAEVASGRFRQDLFFRLDGVTLNIPPLRDRRGAIGMLAMRFLEAAGAKSARPVKIAPEVFPALEGHDWPGNVRELKAVIERAVLLARGGEIEPCHLAFARSAVAEPRPAASAPAPAAAVTVSSVAEPGEDAILAMLTPEQRTDREQVMAALATCNGNQTRAAKLLDISRSTLVNKIALYRIPRPRV